MFSNVVILSVITPIPDCPKEGYKAPGLVIVEWEMPKEQ